MSKRLFKMEFDPKYIDLCKKVTDKSYSKEDLLIITEEILEYNITNYSIWSKRRDLLKTSIEIELLKEIYWTHKLIMNTTFKCYQTWEHLKFVMNILLDKILSNESKHKIIKDELRWMDQIIKIDSKTMHMWEYRIWLLNTYNFYGDDLQTIPELIKKDPDNNSLWSYFCQLLNQLGNKNEYKEFILEYIGHKTAQQVYESFWETK